MTADSHDSDDTASFADEVFDHDFVIEDLLEDRAADGTVRAPKEAEESDADDLLFAAEEGAAPSVFGDTAAHFSEEAASGWSGEGLDLDEDAGPQGAELIEATETVAEELGSLLEDEEDFGLDSEVDLELVTGDEGFGAAAAFVLDEGEGLWAHAEDAPAPAAQADADRAARAPEAFSLSAFEGDPCDGEAPAAADGGADALGGGLFGSVTHELPPSAVAGSVSGVDGEAPAGASAAGDDVTLDVPLGQAGGGVAGAAPDRQPLAAGEQEGCPPTHGSSQVKDDEFDTSGYEDDDVYQDVFDEEPGQASPSGVSDPSLGYDEAPERSYAEAARTEVDGHDIYADEDEELDAVVIGGPGSAPRRWGGALAAAASVAVIGLSAVSLGRPEWFGLAVEPTRVSRVELARPAVTVAVAEPAKVSSLTPGRPGEVAVVAPAQGQELAQASEAGPDSDPGRETSDHAVQVDGSVSPPSPATGPSAPQRALAGAARAAAVPSPGVTGAWPAAPTVETAPRGQRLARFGDDLLVGGPAASAGGAGATLADVTPGSRAFAQLYNGNSFVGRVKKVAEAAITLRVATGEVTLPRDAVARFTRLGSSEYEKLQRATEGSVLLTNNYRLEGGILTQRADDHVVLEVRSNRVMLPEDSVGQIVNGAGGSDVRLGTTAEEDLWLRSIAARKLGTVQGLEAPAQPAPAIGGK